MSYLLDTNAWACYLNRRSSKVVSRIAAVSDPSVVLCSVVKAELLYGAYKSPRKTENLALLHRLFDRFASIPFDDPAADVYGQIRAHLSKAGTPIGPNDLLISSIALANQLTLVTHNTREFSRVPGLQLEDWES